MEKILNIETSTGTCSVALSAGNRILSSRESTIERSHASVLTLFVDEVMKEAGCGYSDLSAVAVSRGPGSYTGLRIGVSAAKGICFGAGIPLIATDTLALMAVMVTGMKEVLPGGDDQARVLSILKGPERYDLLLCPMIDARRMEVYTALYDADGMRVRDISAEIINEYSFRDVPDEKTILFFGDGSEKCRAEITHPNALFIPGIYPSAVMTAGLSVKAFREGKFEDLAYFEPFYLKDFLATVPKNRML